MITHITNNISSGSELSADEVHRACDLLLDESQSLEDRAAFLEALHARGETAFEIASFVEVLLERAVSLPFSGDDCLDVCGTGGDHAGFFNVSTTVMFVVAACGVKVVKHGNRGITSKSGGADVLEALGASVTLSPDSASAALDAAGCCFLFAPNYHPAFKAVAPVRKLLAERGKTSVFNMLGPLLNPARPGYQLAGVFDAKLPDLYAEVFAKIGRKRAWAVHGTGPDQLRLDEVSALGPTRVVSMNAGHRSEFQIEPSSFGIPPVTAAEFAGGDAAHNAGIIAEILAGNLRQGPRMIVQINAAAALVVAGAAPDMAAGWHQAGEAIDSKAARKVLDRLRACR